MSGTTKAMDEGDEEPTHRLPITERLRIAVETMDRARAATPEDFAPPTDAVAVNPTA